jgi:hypothetical protein
VEAVTKVDYSIFIRQLDALIEVHNEMCNRAQHDDLSDLPKNDRQALVTRCIGAIDRIAGSRSTYANEAQRVIKQSPALHLQIPGIVGVAQALRDDLRAGYLQRFSEIVHAEVFSDFLDMAQHLNATGYKDPAAVIAGSTLESHLKELATKNAIATSDPPGRPVKADKLNADLAKAGAYGILDQKSITASLDLRNKAAHGKYSEYTKEQVDNLMSSIADFIKRNPA